MALHDDANARGRSRLTAASDRETSPANKRLPLDGVRVLGLASHSVALYNDWTAGGASAELHFFAAGGHGFGMRTQGLPSDRWIETFGPWLASLGLLH